MREHRLSQPLRAEDGQTNESLDVDASFCDLESSLLSLTVADMLAGSIKDSSELPAISSRKIVCHEVECVNRRSDMMT